MNSIIIKENKSNLKSKQRFYNDKYLDKLTTLLVNSKKHDYIHEYVRDMFYFKSIEEYEEYLPKVLITNEESYN